AAPAPRVPRRGGAEPDAPRRRLRSAAAVLDAAAERLRREPALASRARGLAERAAGLAGGRFTLALFGAFSAGKSSFANALLGEDVLPVSPHPATAAVNRILAPEGGYAHGTAAVAMKTADEFRDDLRHSFSVLELGEPDPEEWPKTAACLEGRGLHPSALPHIGFLRAAAAGWEASRGLLGSVRTVDLDEYRGLVADETKACFVRRIDLYYSSPLTEGGIVLVDTPGADSLHARHTGVTFGYMKEADAIVFLTYYNHAFSKADRALLAQLGRVKDSFALDKMFFIINASDLASDEEELDAVGEHVRTELRTAGLIAPRIYALSSLLALQGRRPGEEAAREASRFDRFQEELMRFAGEELPALSLRAASSLLSSTRRRVEEWAALASRNASEREEELRRRQDWRSEAEAGLRKLACDEMPLAALGREGEELLYHVRQRIGFKFGAMLQESFHPSLLREESGHLKGLFTASGRELWQTAQRELEGELWATTLRLEAAGRRLAAEAAAEEALRLGLDPSDLADREPDACWPSPEGLKAELGPVDWSAYTGLFRSPRHFFEGGGRDRLRSVVEPLLKNALAAAVQGAAGELLHHYRNLTSEALKRAADRLRQMLAEQDEAMEATLKGGESGEHWTALAAELQSREKDLEALSKA
uniref:dynamin family protein n=1 Tax=Paenibacillus glufosinatiresistens TaxID=3070657 RepID=UPI00286D7440